MRDAAFGSPQPSTPKPVTNLPNEARKSKINENKNTGIICKAEWMSYYCAMHTYHANSLNRDEPDVMQMEYQLCQLYSTQM